MFMESMEDLLRRDVILTESGGAESFLQTMLDESVQAEKTDEIVQEATAIQEKLAKILK